MTADASKYRDAVSICQESLSSSDDTNDTTLLQKVNLFTIAPFDQDPANWRLSGWDRVDAIVVLRADAEKQAAERLARLSALPKSPSSLQEYERETSSAQIPSSDLRYLENGERGAYVAKLLLQQQTFEPPTGRTLGRIPSPAPVTL